MSPSVLYKDSRPAADTQELVSINCLPPHKSHPVTTHIFPENETSASNRQNFVSQVSQILQLNGSFHFLAAEIMHYIL